MIRTSLIPMVCALAAMALLASTVLASGGDADRKAIEEVVGYYFAGGDRRDVELMKRAFHPDAKMQFVNNGKLQQVTMPEWFDRISKAPADGPKANYRKVVSVDIATDAAIVRAESDFPTFQFIDYLSLLKVDGQWVIVGKTFHRVDKGTANATR